MDSLPLELLVLCIEEAYVPLSFEELSPFVSAV